MGSRPSSRSVAIKLSRLTPRRCLAQDHAVQLGLGQTVTPTPGADPGHIDVLGNFCRNLGQLADLPGAVGPTAGQLGSAIGTVLHHMLHLSRGRHAGAGKAVRPWLAGPFGWGGFPVGFGIGFEAGHPAAVRGSGLAFQLGNPFLQAPNDRLLPDDEGNQHIAVGGGEVNFSIHALYMT